VTGVARHRRKLHEDFRGQGRTWARSWCRTDDDDPVAPARGEHLAVRSAGGNGAVGQPLGTDGRERRDLDQTAIEHRTINEWCTRLKGHVESSTEAGAGCAIPRPELEVSRRIGAGIQHAGGLTGAAFRNTDSIGEGDLVRDAVDRLPTGVQGHLDGDLRAAYRGGAADFDDHVLEAGT